MSTRDSPGFPPLRSTRAAVDRAVLEAVRAVSGQSDASLATSFAELGVEEARIRMYLAPIAAQLMRQGMYFRAPGPSELAGLRRLQDLSDLIWKHRDRQPDNEAAPARPEGGAASRTLHRLRGSVRAVENGTAFVSLVDEKGREASATCGAAELASYGIGERMQFTCTFVRRGNETAVRFEPVPRRKLTAEEIRQIDDQVERALGDYDPATDR